MYCSLWHGPSVGRSVGRLVGWLVVLSKFPKRAGSCTSMLLSEHLIQVIKGRIKNILYVLWRD